MSGDEVEFFSQVGQRRLRSDSCNHAANAEELGCAAEEPILIRVETESFMTKEPAKVKEITCAAAEIENLKRRCAIEPKVLHMLDIDADPVGCVLVSVDPSRVRPIWIMFAQLI